MRPEWKDFVGGKWENEVNVRDFIQKNYHLYEGDESFLAAPTQNTKDLWAQVLYLAYFMGKICLKTYSYRILIIC